MPRGRKPKPKPDAVVAVVSNPAINSSLWDQPEVARRVDKFWSTHPGEIAHRQSLAELVAEYTNSGDKLIDVGCGTGLLYKPLARNVPALFYVGVDYSLTMLQIARERHPDVNFRGGHAEALDYPDNWFNVAVAFEVFGYFESIDKPISELIRVASKVAIFTMWLTAEDHAVMGADHWEHTDQSVWQSISKALRGQHAVITVQGIGPVVAYAVEKVDDSPSAS